MEQQSIKDLLEVVDLQRRYSDLEADAKDFLNIVINLTNCNGFIEMVRFNDDLMNTAVKMLREFLEEKGVIEKK